MAQITPDEFIEKYPPPHRELVNHLRALIRATVPKAVEGVNVGWGLLAYRIPVGKRLAYWGWIGADGDHAHLGFEYGILLNDPKKLLEGTGTQVRYLTIRRVRDLRKRDFAALIRQAVEIASRSDKRALLKLEQSARKSK